MFYSKFPILSSIFFFFFLVCLLNWLVTFDSIVISMRILSELLVFAWWDSSILLFFDMPNIMSVLPEVIISYGIILFILFSIFWNYNIKTKTRKKWYLYRRTLNHFRYYYVIGLLFFVFVIFFYTLKALIAQIIFYYFMFSNFFFIDNFIDNFLSFQSFWVNYDIFCTTYYFLDFQISLSMFIILSKILILVMTSLYLIIIYLYRASERLLKYEYLILLLLMTLGSFVVVSSNSLLILYLALELQALALFLFVTLNNKIIPSSRLKEASLKYFILGAFISAIYAFGVSLIYSVTGSLIFNEILLCSSTFYWNLSFFFGFLFICSAFLFKLAIVPFHLWVNDIYVGISTLVVCYLAVIPKISAGCILLRLVNEVFFNTYFFSYMLNLLTFIAFLTIVIGMLTALAQVNLRSFLAYSSISNMGYLLLIIANPLDGFSKYLFFAFILLYGITSFILFILVLTLRRWTGYNNSVVYITELSGLVKLYPGLALCFSISLLSLISLPPMVGFFVKYLISCGLLSLTYLILTFCLIFLGVLSSFYYLRIMKIILFDKFDKTLFLRNIDFPVYLFLFFLTLLLFLFSYQSKLLFMIFSFLI